MVNPRQLVAHIEGLPHRRATFKQLLRELRIKAGERPALRAILTELVRTHRIIQTRHGFELPPHPASSRASGDQRPARGAGPAKHAGPAVAAIAGRISVHREGFAFVLPVDAAEAGTLQGDIFVPPPFVGGAMHGDTVEVRIVRRTAEGRAEGQVVRILRRAHATVVGELHYAAHLAAYYVQPYDDRLRERVVIPPHAFPPEMRAGAVPARHRVLGPEARRRPHNSGSGPAAELEGLVVEAEITQYPTASGGESKGRVIEVLGRRDDFGIDVEIIIRKYHLPHRFPPEVLAAAEAAPGTLPAEEISQRRDFRALPIVTIDGETARDFDDAVWVRRRARGGFELQVHIADVAHYVRPATAMDREARLRGTSVYFPDRAVPMLPIELSTDLCSLRPQAERLVMSCVMEFSSSGRLEAYELTPGIIRSAQRMTYTGVNAILSHAADAPSAGGTDFFVMLALERVLNQRRRERGSIDFDLPEPEIAFDEFGLMRSIAKSERNVAHRIIEEFMLAANETVAGHLERLSVPSLYRIHEKPDPRKVAEFEEVAASFGYSLNVTIPMRRLRRRVRGQIRMEMVPSGDAVAITPQHYQRLIEQLAGKPEERIVSYLMLRSLQQARYHAANTGHFALAAPTYTHFTSPIRRYPDLLIHRVLKAVLPPGGIRMERGGDGQWRPAPGAAPSDPAAAPYPTETLQVMAAESSEAERRADEAERELMDWKKVRFMEERIGREFAAMILHVTKAGFFVELVDLFIEGFVPLSALDDDRYVLRPGAHELIGERSRRRYKVGDRLTVLVDRVDPIRHKIDFAPA